MTTQCSRVSALIVETPEAGKALATLERSLAAHVEACARCQGELAAAERLVDELARVELDFEPPAGLAGAVMRRAAARSSAGKVKEGRGASLRGYVLAGLVGAAAATVAVLMALPSGDEAREPPSDGRVVEAPRALGPEAPNARLASVDAAGLGVAACFGVDGESVCEIGREIETAIGQTRAFRLSDGTMLQVDQDTRITLDDARRALTIERGDAFLDVAHRPELAPLTVRLPTGAVEVLGTELEVRAGQALSVVDVVEGVVAVAGDEGKARVKAGQTAWLRTGKRPVVKSSSGANAAARSWGKKIASARDGVEANLGFGSIRARRPGASADADKPLRLVDHLVDVRVQGAFARTTIEESCASDEAHELEGFYRFTLPPGAQVAELSLLVDGRWEEGGFVERDRAEKIWAGVIRQATPMVKRKQIIEYIWVPGPWRDPAILTKSQGNTFELRIFPIPARGERRVRIAYTESLPLVTGGRRYVLPLPSEGAHARAERFELKMQVGTEAPAVDLRVRNYELERREGDGKVMLATEARGFSPRGDLVVEVPDATATEDLLVTAWGKAVAGGDGAVDGYVALTLRPEIAEAEVRREPIDVVVIADVSYGMQKLRLERAGELIRHVVGGLDREDRVMVLACATECRRLGAFEAASESLGRDLGTRIASIEPLGATRLGAAFEAAARALSETPAERRRIIYLGDGVQTVGELEPARIVEGVRQAIGPVRLTAVGLGGETDHAVLGGLAEEAAGSFVDLAKAGGVEASAALVLARLHAEPLRDVELVLPAGLVEVAPARVADLWPGEERLVTARTSARELRGEVVLRGTLAGEPVERRWAIEVTADEQAGNAYVPRLWAERRIAELEARDDLGTKAEVVRLSQAHHVLSRHTSLLVLESPAMAKAFDVKATRAVADWDGEVAAAHGGGELTGASGAVATPDPVAASLAEEDPNSELQAGLEDGADQLSQAGRTKNLESGAGLGWRGEASTDAPMAPSREPMERPVARDTRGGRWVPMKKVWYKEAAIREHAGGIDAAAERELRLRERRLDELPESRERTIALVRWHVRMNAPEPAKRVATRWLDKDRMDPDALVALADIAALEGDLERSRALLSSAVEADPRRAASHERMARLYEAAGEPALACEHRLSRALVARSDVHAQVDAVRCGARESRVLSGLEEGLRTRVERALDRAPRTTRVSGPLRLDASWERAADLDLIVVSPQGEVMSWQGGAELSAEDVTSEHAERLALKARANGRWQVLIARKHGDDPGERVEGTLRITAHGTTRRIPFVIDDDEAVVAVATIDVSAKFRWEEVRP